jgi:hypothetical protein
MNIKKGLLLKLTLLMSLLVVNAMAATPGSACTINARVLGIIRVALPGNVSANGQMCVPLNLLGLPDILTPLGTGVVCNRDEYVLGIIRVRATCAN